MKKKFFKKYALVISCCLFLIWWILGTSATLAWFTDTTPAVRNSFDIGRMNLQVSFKNDNYTEYQPLADSTVVFNDKALYEPGYTQVIYLKIENAGNVDFKYRLSADVLDYTKSTNKFGVEFALPPHLRYGVIFGDDEGSLTRELARLAENQKLMQEFADKPLNRYSTYDDIVVTPENPRYAAVVIYMPEDVGNEANHLRGFDAPQVFLGLTVYAQQAGTPMPTE